MTRLLLFAGFCLLVASMASTAPVATAAEPIPDPAPELPPELPWSGKSRSLIVPADDPWITPAERSGLLRTPRYDETMKWLAGLVDSSRQLRMISLGDSPEGRAIQMVIASADGADTPQELRRGGRPIVLAHSGIHAGEIDGKDAGMMLLRDLALGKHDDLLEHVSFLFIPILNVDGHERFSRYGRVNQRGPEEMGWRTTSRNLNLNRDFAKLDAPETRALIAAMNTWEPDLYLDLHVTDGVDFQYDLTWGYNGPHGYSPAIAGWLEEHFDPPLQAHLREWGHIPGPLFFPADRTDMSQGVLEWTGSPRFSNGYGDARHLPTVLLENHSLKPYPQRVLGTYLFLESALRVVASEGAGLRKAVALDRKRRPEEVPLAWGVSPEASRTLELLAVESRKVPSKVTGGERVEWTGEPVTMEVPFLVMSRVTAQAERTDAYWIPPAWSEVIERLELHGIQVERIEEPRELQVEIYRIEDGEIEPRPFEGHVRMKGVPRPESRTVTFAPGAARVSTDQPLGDLATLLLEPDSPDSFFRWGFFLEILQRTEYIEGYVIDPMGERMLASDPDLSREFQAKVQEDEAFAADPQARRRWFYERTPYFDDRWMIYPVARERSRR